MTLNFLFWLLMILWLVFGFWSTWPNHKLVGGNLLLFLLFFIIGWRLFGFPIQS